MPADNFSNFADSPSSPASNCFAITPSDSTQLALVTKALYIGTGGDVTLRSVQSGADVVFRNVATGSVLDVRASYVRATGTTAANIVGLA